MSATAARGRARRPGTATHRHPHSERPSREELQQQVEQQQGEIERLRDQLAEREKQIAEREKQIADAEKQIADLERQLALRKRNSTNSSKPPASDGLAGEQRARGRKHKSKRKPGAQPGTLGIIAD
jgi:septal ring factor EnvC (AmiA/AmiB activator)